MKSSILPGRSPFARLLLFYALGMLMAEFISVKPTTFGSGFTAAAILLLLIGFIVADRYPGYHTNWVSGLMVAVVLFFAGMAGMGIYNDITSRQSKPDNYSGLFIFDILHRPEIKENSVKTQAVMKFRRVNGLEYRENRKVILIFTKDTSAVRLLPGCRIAAATRINQVSPPSNPYEFNYQAYLAARGIHHQAFIRTDQWKLVDYNSKRSVSIVASTLQQHLLEKYKLLHLNNTLYSLLSAITLGYKNDLEAHTRQIFSQAGVMHVMALSGFNVAVIAFALNYLLFFLDRSGTGRIVKALVVIFMVWLFVFVTGLSPSVTRAAVMLSFVIGGKTLHRQVNTYNILFASAFLLLTLSPPLISDVSFQLSFSAVLGILLFQPLLSDIIKTRFFIINRLWQLFAVSCAAQLATLPLTLLYFHQFPLYFWLTNLYVVPLVSLIICIAGIYLLVSFVNPIMMLMGKLLTLLLAMLYKSVAFIEVLPYALLENIHISGFQAFLLMMAILFLGLFRMHRSFNFLVASLATILLLQLTVFSHALSMRHQQVFLVADINKASLISAISGTNAVIFGDSLPDLDDPGLKYALNNFWVKHGVAGKQYFYDQLPAGTIEKMTIPGMTISGHWLGNNVVIELDNRKILVLRDDTFFNHTSERPFHTDYLTVSGSVFPNADHLSDLLETSMIIIDSSVPFQHAIQWKNYCSRKQIACWQVSKQGAFQLMPKNTVVKTFR
ncbi:MAG: ComEC family competence protein [Bacteroidales bacterium]|nr:ComEC family competence protein [Bacteroidales bacterium]